MGSGGAWRLVGFWNVGLLRGPLAGWHGVAELAARLPHAQVTRVLLFGDLLGGTELPSAQCGLGRGRGYLVACKSKVRNMKFPCVARDHKPLPP